MRDSMMNVAALRTARDAVSMDEAKEVGVGALQAALSNRILRVMDRGVVKFYELKDAQLAMSSMMAGHNPRKRLAEMFGGDDTAAGRGTAKAFIGGAQILRDMVTRTPPFMLKNIFRDSWSAMALTGGGPEVFIEAVRNALDATSYERAQRLGLAVGIDFVAEPGKYGKKMRDEMKKEQRLAESWADPVNAVGLVWDATGRLAGQSEVATRLAVYDRVLAKTGDKALAQHMALEIMNYGRRGASPLFSLWLATVPFLNGRIQGLDVFMRAHLGSTDAPNLERYGLTRTGEGGYDDLPMFRKTRGALIARGGQLAMLTAT